jgi:cytidylate kinase
VALAVKAICISHSGWAGGETVGRAVAERLGFRYVDDEVIAEAAEWGEIDAALVANVEQRRSLIGRLLGDVSERTSPPRLQPGDATRALPSDADLRMMIGAAIRSLADKGSVVIVAHAASFAVGGPDFLRVLVTASPEVRAQRVIASDRVDERRAAQLVKADDVARADYLKRFYAIERELPTHFDLVLNTDVVTPETAAEVVVSAARSSTAA